MDTHVNYDNINQLLIGIAQNLKTRIAAIDLTVEQKTAIAVLDRIINTGDGTKYLSNDGTYKTLPVSSIATMIEQIGIINSLFNINTVKGVTTYSLQMPQTLTDKLNIIITNGIGDKLLTNNGTYQEYIPSGYRELTADELNTIINNIKTNIV